MSQNQDRWRLIIDPPADGAWNMSVDEALLLSVQQGLAPTTLRFYRWRPATVSLGYFQPADDVNLAAVRCAGLGLVRRPTGGRAILHDDELTYAVVAPADAIPGGRSIGRSYTTIARALLAALRLLGVRAAVGHEQATRATLSRACFALSTRADIAAEGIKLIGSAQLRRGGVILQHGSIPLTLDAAMHEQLFGPADAAKAAAGLADLLGRRPTWDELIDAFVEGFRQTLGIDFVPGQLTDAEAEAARRLKEEKYATDAYTLTAPTRPAADK